MSQPDAGASATPSPAPKTSSLARQIIIGLCLGIGLGIFFGEYCSPLQVLGDAYVGLLQMTVLPYLVLSLIGKLARLDVIQARKLGFAALGVLLVFCLVGVVQLMVLTVIVSEWIRGRLVVRRPIGIAVRSQDSDWRSFLDRRIDYERQDGSIDRLRSYWIEGRGTLSRSPRWCVARDLLGWIP